MDIIKPNQGEITVYSKSGCVNCVNVKNALKKLINSNTNFLKISIGINKNSLMIQIFKCSKNKINNF